MKTARAILVLSLALLAGACGFHPLYGSYGGNGPMRATLAAIYVEPITDKLGYELRNQLIDIFDASGDSSGALYRLKVTFTQTTEGIAITSNTTVVPPETDITRYNDKINISYELSDKGGKLLTKGTETALSTYNVVASPYATLTAQQDADKRAAEDAADRIRLDLAYYFSKAKDTKP